MIVHFRQFNNQHFYTTDHQKLRVNRVLASYYFVFLIKLSSPYNSWSMDLRFITLSFFIVIHSFVSKEDLECRFLVQTCQKMHLWLDKPHFYSKCAVKENGSQSLQLTRDKNLAISLSLCQSFSKSVSWVPPFHSTNKTGQQFCKQSQ